MRSLRVLIAEMLDWLALQGSDDSMAHWAWVPRAPESLTYARVLRQLGMP